MRLGSIAGTGGSLFLRKGLVTAQVALSFLLLFGAGLFVRSLQNLKRPTPVSSWTTCDLPGRAGAQRLHERARGAVLWPAARALRRRGIGSAANMAILSGGEWDSSMSVEGHRAADGEDMQAFMNALSPGYRHDEDPAPRRA